MLRVVDLWGCAYYSLPVPHDRIAEHEVLSVGIEAIRRHSHHSETLYGPELTVSYMACLGYLYGVVYHTIHLSRRLVVFHDESKVSRIHTDKPLLHHHAVLCLHRLQWMSGLRTDLADTARTHLDI